jgi:hypothetical protein
VLALARRKAPLPIALLVLLLLSGFALSLRAAAQETAPLWDVASAPQPAPTGNAALDRVLAPDGIMRFDVAEDMSRFAFAASPVHDDGMPAHGNPFITQGYLYPYGTLSATNGVNPDGSPEFPELVLGEWTCRGWFVGEGAHATSGAWVITTQLYSFGEGPVGDTVLVSEGYEIADVGEPAARAITGGTGPFAAARGAGEQTFLGFNASEGVNLRFELAVADLSAAESLPATSQFPPYS